MISGAVETTPIQKCIKIIKEMRDLAKRDGDYFSLIAFEYCFLTLQNHLIDEVHYNNYNENDVIFAIQEAYGHRRDEADEDLHKQVEHSIQVILRTIKDKKIVK